MKPVLPTHLYSNEGRVRVIHVMMQTRQYKLRMCFMWNNLDRRTVWAPESPARREFRDGRGKSYLVTVSCNFETWMSWGRYNVWKRGGGNSQRRYIYCREADRKFAALKVSRWCLFVRLVKAGNINIWDITKVKRVEGAALSYEAGGWKLSSLHCFTYEFLIQIWRTTLRRNFNVNISETRTWSKWYRIIFFYLASCVTFCRLGYRTERNTHSVYPTTAAFEEVREVANDIGQIK